MDMPSWRDDNLGTMKRAGLWLVQEVGEGNVFTKSSLREAFPGTSQVDRRIRDLRDFGWQISTNREDRSLDPEEQRFVRMGEPVWEPGKATRKTTDNISAAARQEVMIRDGRRCRSCGASPGDSYEGTTARAKLDIARREVLLPDGSVEMQLVLECTRCRVGAAGFTVDVPEVLRRVSELSGIERRIMAGWVERDARTFSALEDLWALYRAMPADSRTLVRDALDSPGAA
jgi:hypothetical protein